MDKKERLKYGIIGVGGIGGYYGGRLANAGFDVSFLLHTDYNYVKINGLRVESCRGDFIVKPIAAIGSPQEMPVCDVMLVCLKTTNNYLLPKLLQHAVGTNTITVLLQNGLGNEAALSAMMPDLRLAGGLAFICAWKAGAGYIVHADYGMLNIGGYNLTETDMETLAQVQRDFIQSGIKCTLTNDLYAARWQKLLWNIPYNGLTVALNTTTARLMQEKPSRELVRRIMHEVVNAANACGVPMNAAQVDKMMEMTDTMRPYSPSMKLDCDAHRPLEIEAIYTRPVQEARRHGCEMPCVEMLEEQLQFIQATNAIVVPVTPNAEKTAP
ncbi:MAG: putative 2-dehydropantoate 2-reductase [Bacteroidales bacterium]|jgi:2-dehydropantoate 2-reductase|nr:putative 2-dehydropantoate 2-reductase [Bacteroidales bacterium]